MKNKSQYRKLRKEFNKKSLPILISAVVILLIIVLFNLSSEIQFIALIVNLILFSLQELIEAYFIYKGEEVTEITKYSHKKITVRGQTARKVALIRGIISIILIIISLGIIILALSN